jgi:DNA-directed RNA polymerase specialized sigma24 family protein
MKKMSDVKPFLISQNENSLYATPLDFKEVFTNEITDLLRLSLQLTADAEKAESCVIVAMKDCFGRSCVSKSQVHTWARRMVIRNAIRMVWRTPNNVLRELEFELHLQPGDVRVEELRESVAILSLPDFDRLAFVICMLERYSILDCAFLLGHTAQEVHDAIVRARRELLPGEKIGQHPGTASFAGDACRGCLGKGNRFEGS